MFLQVIQCIIEIIKVLINPWTVLILFILIYFKNEISLILKSLSLLTNRVEKMSFGDNMNLSFSKEKTIDNLKEETKKLNMEGKNTESLINLVDAISEKITELDFAIFNQLFRSSNTLVIGRGNKYEGTLYKLLEIGIIVVSEIHLMENTYLQQWSTTPLGEILLKNMTK